MHLFFTYCIKVWDPKLRCAIKIQPWFSVSRSRPLCGSDNPFMGITNHCQKTRVLTLLFITVARLQLLSSKENKFIVGEVTAAGGTGLKGPRIRKAEDPWIQDLLFFFQKINACKHDFRQKIISQFYAFPVKFLNLRIKRWQTTI